MHLVSPHKGIAFWLGTQVVELATAHQASVAPGVPNPPPLGHLGFSSQETRFGGFFLPAFGFPPAKKNRRRTPALRIAEGVTLASAKGPPGATLPRALQPELENVIGGFRQGKERF